MSESSTPVKLSEISRKRRLCYLAEKLRQMRQAKQKLAKVAHFDLNQTLTQKAR